MKTMQNKDYISFDMAKSLKSLGFDYSYCDTFYDRFGNWLSYEQAEEYLENYPDDITPRPSLSELQTWLREHKKVYVSVLPFRCKDYDDCMKLGWYCSIIFDDGERDILCNATSLSASEENYETYDEALYAGLEDAIETLQDR